MNERVEKLREQSLNAVPYISMERAELVTEVYKEYSGKVSIPMLRALAFKNIMENKKLCINDGELIVGERGEAPAATPTYPELCCHSLEDLEIMDKREKISFRVSSGVREFQEHEIIPYWEDLSMRKKILDAMTDEWKDCYEAGIFTEFMEQRGPGHTVADDKIYKKGFKVFKEDIADAVDSLNPSDPQADAKVEQLEAMSVCCEAIIAYGRRYAQFSEKLAAEETDAKRRTELLRIAEICRWVPENAPRTFEEALQMYWFVHVGVITEMNNWDAFNPGRLDQHLYPFYKREIDAGTLSREKAEELLQCFWVKFNNQPAPPKVGVTLKESGTYTDFANINSGGLTADGEDGVNELTYLILDVIDDMRLLQPSSNVQVSSKSPHKFVKRACEIVRKGWGQPSFFNADAVVKEMLYMGKDIVDARCGGTSGCVETGSFGKESYILTGYFNIPKVLEITLNNGVDPETGRKIGVETWRRGDGEMGGIEPQNRRTAEPQNRRRETGGLGEWRGFETYEELFEAFRKQMEHFIDIKIRGNDIIERFYAENMPVPFLSTVISDCIKNGKDYNAGGARYNTMYIQGVGIGAITDSLAAIKKHVYEEGNFTMQELLDAMKANFEGHENVYSLVRNRTPKYGNDDDYADEIMQRVFNMFHELVDGRPSVKGGTYRINMLPTTCHIYFGSVIGALPNGRKAHMPLPEGISPSKGADRYGPTAVLKSASKMNHLITGGTLLNQKFTPQVLEDDKGLESLVHLIRSYFKLNGHHIQFNVINKETLLDAQKNPNDYNDLIVRVAGYSDYFNNLDKALQDEIIQRTEQGL
jgi:pyruvate formate-lyase/glycerol dehydratase family glycyl radical enzyme